MCGLTGCMGALNIKAERAFRDLLVFDSVRGEHSTGVAFVSKLLGNVTVAKQTGDPFQLFDNRRFGNAFAGVNRVLLGHNRYATQGAVNNKNAHPFELDTLVGAHNGTLTNKRMLADHLDFQVDSENAFHHMEKHGLRDLLDIVRGAYTFTWWDKEDHTMNFLRNAERPLWMAEDTKNDIVFWASEKWMLDVALSRHDIDYKIDPLPIDSHWSFHVDQFGKIHKPRVTEAKQKPVPVYVAPPVNQGKNHNPFPQGPQKQDVTQNSGALTTTSVTQAVPSEEKKSQDTYFDLCDTEYLHKKSIPVEVLALCTDENGSSYVSLFDTNEPSYHIRCYVNRNDELVDAMGDTIFVTIGRWIAGKGSAAGHYRVSPHEVRYMDESLDNRGDYFTNSHGKLVPKEEWEDEHACCESCGGYVDPASNFRFTTNHETICEVCVKDPGVQSSVTMRS